MSKKMSKSHCVDLGGQGKTVDIFVGYKRYNWRDWWALGHRTS